MISTSKIVLKGCCSNLSNITNENELQSVTCEFFELYYKTLHANYYPISNYIYFIKNHQQSHLLVRYLLNIFHHSTIQQELCEINGKGVDNDTKSLQWIMEERYKQCIFCEQTLNNNYSPCQNCSLSFSLEDNHSLQDQMEYMLFIEAVYSQSIKWYLFSNWFAFSCVHNRYITLMVLVDIRKANSVAKSISYDWDRRDKFIFLYSKFNQKLEMSSSFREKNLESYVYHIGSRLLILDCLAKTKLCNEKFVINLLYHDFIKEPKKCVNTQSLKSLSLEVFLTTALLGRYSLLMESYRYANIAHLPEEYIYPANHIMVACQENPLLKSRLLATLLNDKGQLFEGNVSPLYDWLESFCHFMT